MTDNIKEQKTKTLHRTNLATQAPLNTGAELRCFERDNSSCSTYDTRRVTFKRHEHQHDMEIILDTRMCKFIQLIVIKHELMTK